MGGKVRNSHKDPENKTIPFKIYLLATGVDTKVSDLFLKIASSPWEL